MKELLLKSARLSWVQRFTKRLCWEKTGSSSTLKVAQGKRHGQLSKASVQGSQREPKLHAPIARIWNDQGLTDRLAGGPSRREKPPAHKLIRLQRRPGRPALPHTQTSVISVTADNGRVATWIWPRISSKCTKTSSKSLDHAWSLSSAASPQVLRSPQTGLKSWLYLWITVRPQAINFHFPT